MTATTPTAADVHRDRMAAVSNRGDHYDEGLAAFAQSLRDADVKATVTINGRTVDRDTGELVGDDGGEPADAAADAVTDAVTDVRPASERPRGRWHRDEYAGLGGRELIEGGYEYGDYDRYPQPDDLYPVRRDTEFDLGGFDADFMAAADVKQIAAALIGERVQLRHLAGVPIAYRWKRTGGADGQTARYSACVKLPPPARHAFKAEFLVWLAADHLTDAKPTYWQVEALIFRALLAADITEKGKPAIRPPDFSGYAAEWEFYGPYRQSLGYARSVYKQASFYDDATAPAMGERGALDREPEGGL